MASLALAESRHVRLHDFQDRGFGAALLERPDQSIAGTTFTASPASATISSWLGLSGIRSMLAMPPNGHKVTSRVLERGHAGIDPGKRFVRAPFAPADDAGLDGPFAVGGLNDQRTAAVAIA